VEEYRQPEQQPSSSSLISSRCSSFYWWEHHHVANLLLVSFFSSYPSPMAEAPLPQRSDRASPDPPHGLKALTTSGHQEPRLAARSKSSPSICCRPEHTSLLFLFDVRPVVVLFAAGHKPHIPTFLSFYNYSSLSYAC
jgi:hypothetical protein